MGTRSVTIIQGFVPERKRKREEIAVIYRQYDGYIEEGHGEELAKFCADREIVNGFTLGTTREKQSNGMECFAASLVAELKDDIGGIYLYPAGVRDLDQDYTYTVYPSNKDLFSPHRTGLMIKVEDSWNNKVIFDGPAEELVNFKEPEDDE